ncbi:MAG: hypothetical protein K2X39_02695 [Silvanigrellaceae bacterium]|nr:hypothetical protein [Silvanigrellaceae bacterium]
MMKTFLLLYLLLTSLPAVYADHRILTLYPFEDTQLQDDNLPGEQRLLFSLTESAYFSSLFPCIFFFKHVPLFYKVLQGGISCSFTPQENSEVSFTIAPETGFGPYQSKQRTAALLGLGYTISLSPQREFIFHTDLNYKISNSIPIAQTTLKQPSLWFLIQQWGHVYDSSLALSFIIKSSSQTSATRLVYQQTLPLELREFGALKKSHAAEIKNVGVDYRYGFRHVTLGGGVFYLVVNYDQLRFAGFLPSLYLSFQI